MSTLERNTQQAVLIMRRLKPDGIGQPVEGPGVFAKPKSLIVNPEFFKQKIAELKQENEVKNKDQVIYLEDFKNKRLVIAESKITENQPSKPLNTETLKDKYLPKKQLKDLLSIVKSRLRGISKCNGSHDMEKKCGSFRCKVRKYKRIGRPMRVEAQTPQPEKTTKTPGEKPQKRAS